MTTPAGKPAKKAAPAKAKEPEVPSAPPEAEAAPEAPAETSAEPVSAVLENITSGAPDAAETELVSGETDGVMDSIEPEPDLVAIGEPCPQCYPKGWFEGAVLGARASCGHLSIVFGEFETMTRERAIELGYVDRSEKQ